MPAISSIRQSGGANIISIPKAIINTLDLDVGSKMELSIQNNAILLTPVKQEVMTLESLLKDSPKSCFKITDEDRVWIDSPPVGRETI
jgi:antitoxin ChpS